MNTAGIKVVRNERIHRVTLPRKRDADIQDHDLMTIALMDPIRENCRQASLSSPAQDLLRWNERIFIGEKLQFDSPVFHNNLRMRIAR